MEKELIFFCVCSVLRNSSAAAVINSCLGRAGAIPLVGTTNRVIHEGAKLGAAGDPSAGWGLTDGVPTSSELG